MRSTSRAWLLAAVAAPLCLGGCAILEGVPEAATAPEVAKAEPLAAKPPKAEPPAASAAPAEPAASAESRRLFEQAVAALAAGRFAEAERGLLGVVRREPRLAGPRANLGILYSRTGREAEALEALRGAVKLNPNRAAYYNEIGMILRRAGKFDDARGSYAKALEVDPTYAYAHLNIGILYDLYLQELDKALDHYRRYRELAPSEAPTVAKWIADLRRRAGKSEQAKRGKSG